MNFEEQLAKFESSQGGNGTENVTEEVTTESVIPNTEEVTKTIEENKTEEVINPVVEEKVKEEQVQQPDYNKFLEESSEGVFKSVDEFKSSLAKFKDYDTKVTEYESLKKEREELESKYNSIDPFAKKYDELVKAGKTQDQIDSFVKINKLGDLSQLDPYQLKVEELVQEGYKRDVAERKITRDFGLNIEIEGDHLSEEEIEHNKALLEDKKEELRISSQSSLAKLEELKVKLSNTQNDDANNRVLAEQAQIKEYNEKLKPLTAKIASQYNGLGQLNVNGGEGDKAKVMNFEVEPEFKAYAEQKLYEYFQDGKTPVNDETVAEAKVYLDAQWLYQNKEKFAQINYNQGVADTKTAVVDEFENKSGIPTSGLAPVNRTAEQSLRDQQRKVALGED